MCCCGLRVQAGEEEAQVEELTSAWDASAVAAITRMSAVQQGRSQQLDQQQQTLQQTAVVPAEVQQRDTGVTESLSDDASRLAPGGSIELRNVYFEAVPLHLVTAVITDRGVMDSAQVAALMHARGIGYQQAFSLHLPDDMLAP